MNAFTVGAIVIGLILAFAVYLGVTSGLRMFRDKGPLRLYRLAEGKGLRLPGPPGEADVRAAALAARRCAGCTAHDRCDGYLERADYDGLRRICPNTAYLDRLGS